MKVITKPVLTLEDQEYDILFHARYILRQVVDYFASTENYGRDLDCIRDSANRAHEDISHILDIVQEDPD